MRIPVGCEAAVMLFCVHFLLGLVSIMAAGNRITTHCSVDSRMWENRGGEKRGGEGEKG